MTRILPALAALTFTLSCPVSAQTGGAVAPVAGLPATAWEAAYARPLDDAAVAAPEVFLPLAKWASVSDPGNPALYRKDVGEAKAKLVIGHLRRDGKLEGHESDLLEEFAFPRERVIELTRLSTGARPDKVSKTAVTPPPPPPSAAWPQSCSVSFSCIVSRLTAALIAAPWLWPLRKGGVA